MIELMVISSVVLMIVAFSGNVLTRLFSDQKRIRFDADMVLLRDNYASLFQGIPSDAADCPAGTTCVATDSRAWKATLTHAQNNGPPAINAGFTCLENNGDCFGIGVTAFSPAQSDGNLAFNFGPAGYDPANTATQRFDAKGLNTCTVTNPTDLSNACPVRIDFRWEPRCAASPCLNPYVDITIDFTFFFESTSPLAGVNSDRYDRVVTRPGNANAIEQATCLSTQALIGFNDDGSLICEEILTISPDPCRAPWNLLNGQSGSFNSISSCCGTNCCAATEAVVTCNDGVISDPSKRFNCSSTGPCPPPPCGKPNPPCPPPPPK